MSNGRYDMSNDRDIEFMRLAINEAKRSIHKDNRVHPNVGAVVVRDDKILASACHGDRNPCDHAEFTVLEQKLKADTLAGCTVYTTLEPCTHRNHPKVSCADRLIERRISRVAVGMLDPNQEITGKAILKLRRAGIAVDLFPPGLMAELEELNRDFIRDQESVDPASRTCPLRSRGQLPPMGRWSSARTARDILIIGQNLSLVLRQKDFFKAKLADGATIRLLIVDPRNEDLIDMMSRGVEEQHHTKPDFEPALKTIRWLRDTLPAERRLLLDVRVIDYVPTLSFQVLDGGIDSGTILVELAPNRVPVPERPHFVLEARNPIHSEWYQRFLRNCEKMYEEAQPWSWT
jgi:pyrimidine deaminase RibD-like protein